MVLVLNDGIGNAAASHVFGRNQAFRIESAREQVANLIGGRPSQTVFTAGATESNNLVLLGILQQARGSRNKLLISAVEHASVYETAMWISDNGLATIEVIPVSSGEIVDPLVLGSLVDTDTLLVSVMAANSETGACSDEPNC